jgi:shikimate dehydrogenase
MHNAGFDSLGLDFHYGAFPCSDTAAGIAAMRNLGLRGMSLTIPHKERALDLLDEISEEVKAIGSANTVINTADALLGFNTDHYGVSMALKEAGYQSKDRPALVFGAGGAARAAVYALRQLNVEEIFISNRNIERAEVVARDFDIGVTAYETLNADFVASLGLFINATPIGLSLAGDGARYPFALSSFGSGSYVFDMVTRDTQLLAEAKASGASVVHGSRMLLFQALKQFELFTELPKAPLAVMEEALASALSAAASS